MIKNIINEYRRAKAMPHSLTRAQIMLAVQRMAMQSRSKKAYDIECGAHLACVCAIDNVPGATQAERSELGRIMAESKYLFQNGFVGGESRYPSRLAIRAE